MLGYIGVVIFLFFYMHGYIGSFVFYSKQKFEKKNISMIIKNKIIMNDDYN